MRKIVVALLISAIINLFSTNALACACGCGIFDVGTSSMLPTSQGGMAFIEYDFLNQNKNWHGSSNSSSANNPDKTIKSQFLTIGAQYMFNRSWGASVEIPYWYRHFTTSGHDHSDMGMEEDDSMHSATNRFNHSSIGDIKIKGIYSGFSPDMSTGITYGLKLPTGDFHSHKFDRDTQIGTGSTNLLLGVYHMGKLKDDWNWFADAELDQPVLISADYMPGREINISTGVYYNGWNIGHTKIAPIVSLTNSYRSSDHGSAAMSSDSGYEKIVMSPGIEVKNGNYRIFANVGIPAYQDVKGQQLTAPALFKLNISRSF